MSKNLKIKISPLAEEDFNDIWYYSYEHWNFQQANKYLFSLKDAIQLISINPKIGADFSHITKGYRCFTINYHKIFYKINPNHIEIIRVLHESMDIDRHL